MAAVSVVQPDYSGLLTAEAHAYCVLPATGSATATAAHTSKAFAHMQHKTSTVDQKKVTAGRLTIAAGCKLWQCKFVE